MAKTTLVTNLSRNNPVKLAECLIHGLVRGGISPSELASGFHNALAHGHLFEKSYGKRISDKNLEKVMEAAERFSKAIRKAEK
jgi:hypothetical protein